MTTEVKFHELANCFPYIEDDAFDALVASIKAIGLLNPITTWGSEILDGRNRYLACAEAGVEPVYAEFEGSPEEAFEFVVAQNFARREMTIHERINVAAKLANLGHGGDRSKRSTDLLLSNKQAAESMGVSEPSVKRRRTVAADGTDALNAAVEQGDVSVSAAATLTQADPEVQDRVAAHPEEAQAEIKKLPHVTHASGDNEWYTPKDIIEAARIVMGSIDTDPASCEVANKIIRAEAYFDEENDGLAQKNHWIGNVWINPPYSGNLIGRFIEKLADMVIPSRRNFLDPDDAPTELTEQACVLVNNATETKWFRQLADIGDSICFPTGRVKYWHPDTSKGSTPLQGQAIVYIGPNGHEFRKQFSKFGFVVNVTI